jgi:hypothetical protein
VRTSGPAATGGRVPAKTACSIRTFITTSAWGAGIGCAIRAATTACKWEYEGTVGREGMGGGKDLEGVYGVEGGKGVGRMAVHMRLLVYLRMRVRRGVGMHMRMGVYTWMRLCVWVKLLACSYVRIGANAECLRAPLLVSVR